MENQNSPPSAAELSGCIDPIRQMFLEFCQVNSMDPNNQIMRFIFFSSAMILYNTMVTVMRNGTNQELADLTKHMRDDLNLYFMSKDSTTEH
jgi:hypothetical protein